jgi:hypothetical protein
MIRSIAICLALVAGPVMGHEFWLEPLEYQIGSGRALRAELVSGERFAGAKVPYIPRNIVSYAVFAGDKTAKVSMRVGDMPGLQQTPLAEGLHVVAYQSTVATLHYPQWEKFQSFARRTWVICSSGTWRARCPGTIFQRPTPGIPKP